MRNVAEPIMRPNVHAAAFKHDVFISYSRHNAAFARKLEQALKRYKAPKDLKVAHRHLDVFLDTEDFAAGDYHQTLTKHLKDSAKLIVVCSPDARKSEYVNDEIRRFTQLRGADHIIPILFAGVPNEEATAGNMDQMAFPEALCEAMRMPLAANYLTFNTRMDRIDGSAFAQSWYTTLANIYNIGRSEIEQRERKRRVRGRRMTYGLFTISTILIACAMGVVFFLTSRVSEELRSVEGRYQLELVADRARQIEIFADRYRSLVFALTLPAQAAGDLRLFTTDAGKRILQETAQNDPDVLAIVVVPVGSAPQIAYKQDDILAQEIDEAIAQISSRLSGTEMHVEAGPMLSSQIMTLTIAQRLKIGKGQTKTIGTLFAMTSLEQTFSAVQVPSSKSAADLLDAGLPFVFVVDGRGKSIYPRDESLDPSSNNTSMARLKVVTDWMESGAQVQSALSPFNMELQGRTVTVLGSYATADIAPNAQFGVIAIQLENSALASVSEMRDMGTTLAVVIGVAIAGLIGLALLMKLLYYDRRFESSRSLRSRFERSAVSEPRRLFVSLALMTVGALGITSTIATITLREYSPERTTKDERSAISNLRTLHAAQATYQATAGRGAFGTLQQLREQELIDGALSEGTKSGYRFTVDIPPMTTEDTFDATAEPSEGTGFFGGSGRSFYLNESGVIYATNGAKAGSRDNPGRPVGN